MSPRTIIKPTEHPHNPYLDESPLFNLVPDMPLNKSAAVAARQANIREMIDSGHPPAQAEAAAYSVQRKAKAKKRGRK